MEGLGGRGVFGVLDAISEYAWVHGADSEAESWGLCFSLDDELYGRFMRAVKTVANILEKAFDTPRVALVFEGTGVAHVHAKLIPLHGDLADQTDVWSPHKEFHEEYRGWLTTAEGPKMDDARLDEVQAKILGVQG